MTKAIFTLCIPHDGWWDKIGPHKQKIIDNHLKYADICNADYYPFELPHAEWPDSDYNNANWSKYGYAEELAHDYEQILFIDFDVLIETEENIFGQYNWNQGVLVRKMIEYDLEKIMLYIAECERAELYTEIGDSDVSTAFSLPTTGYTLPDDFTPKSDIVKLAGADSIRPRSDLFNTGVMGFTPKTIADLDIFHPSTPFNDVTDFYPELHTSEVWPDWITKHIDKNNEMLFSARVNNYIDIGDKWNHLVDWQSDVENIWDIPKSNNPNFLHYVTKQMPF